MFSICAQFSCHQQVFLLSSEQFKLFLYYLYYEFSIFCLALYASKNAQSVNNRLNGNMTLQKIVSLVFIEISSKMSSL